SHETRPNVSRHAPVLVTMRCRTQRLREQAVFERIHSCLSKLREEGASRIAQSVFCITHFSVQDNHIHLIIAAHSKDDLARGSQGLAIRIARRVNRQLGRKGTFWNDRYHANVLKSPRQVRNALVYVLHNRKKHGALSGVFDFMSSCAWFSGWRDL